MRDRGPEATRSGLGIHGDVQGEPHSDLSQSPCSGHSSAEGASSSVQPAARGATLQLEWRARGTSAVAKRRPQVPDSGRWRKSSCGRLDP